MGGDGTEEESAEETRGRGGESAEEGEGREQRTKGVLYFFSKLNTSCGQLL